MPSRPFVRNASLAALLLGGLSIGSPACSGSPAFDGNDGGSGGSTGSCAVADKSLCGVTCDGDNDCAAGLFCDVGDTCQAQCVAGTTAAPECDGRPCAANGRCIGSIGSGGVSGVGGSTINPGDGGGGGLGGGGNCIDVDVTPTPIIPNVQLLIDRSRSMTGEGGYDDLVQAAIDAGDYTPWECMGPVAGFAGAADAELWRWNVVRSVLFNPVDGVTTQLGDRVRFGLTTYSNDSAVLDMCPALTNVDLAFENRDAMLASFACSSLIWETPTRESLAATADALAALAVEGPKFIVLATDGLPDNCACPNWVGGECDSAAELAERAAVVTEATRVHDTLGITVHVIDVSTPDNPSLRTHLEEVAAAGGGDLYDGTDPAGLIDAFEMIIGDALSCVIQLDGNIVAGKESTGTVTLGGEELVYEEDWIVPQSDQIELIEEACTQYKTEGSPVSVEFPCGVFIVK
jgi:hypothetical protein